MPCLYILHLLQILVDTESARRLRRAWMALLRRVGQGHRINSRRTTEGGRESRYHANMELVLKKLTTTVTTQCTNNPESVYDVSQNKCCYAMHFRHVHFSGVRL